MMKKLMAAALSAAMVLSMGITAFAGSWQYDTSGWRWLNDDGSYATTGWEWIDDDGDGMAEYYYFDENGYCLADQTTPDGYTVNQNGAWMIDDVVQQQAVSEAADTVTAAVTGPVVASIDTVTDSYPSTGTAELTISYQQITLNDNATDALKQAVAVWNQEIAAEMSSWEARHIADAEGTRYPYKYTQNVLVALDDGSFLSLSSEYYEYTGGAHGDGYSKNVVYNAQTGEICTLASLVADYQAFGSKILPYIETQLNSDYELYSNADEIIEQEWNEGTIDWYLSEAGLTFTFGHYEIGPHSSGTPEVTYPMSLLADDLAV